MANTNAPFGFVAVENDAHGTTRTYPLASAYGTAIYPGDPVSLDGNGKVIIASGTTPILGIFRGVSYTDTNGEPKFGHWPASQATLGSEDAEALIQDDPNLHFIAQTDADFAQADVGLLVPVVIGSPSTTFKRSGAYVSSTAGGSTAADQVKIVKVRPGSESGAYAVLECRWAHHVLGGPSKATEI